MIRTTRRVLGAAGLAVLAALAMPGPAYADTVLTDSAYHVGTSSDSRWTVGMSRNWWNVVTTRGYNYDFDLTLRNSAGTALGASTFSSYAVDFVAVNGNDSCSASGGVNDTAVVHPFGPAPTTSDSPADNAYTITRRAGGHVFGVTLKSSADSYTVLQYADQHEMALFDVYLQANTTYRVAWTSVHGWFGGGLYMFRGADNGSNCVTTRNSNGALLWHDIENIGDSTRGGETRYVSTVAGWYGLLLVTQEWDLNQVSIGGGDSQPHLMVKPA